MAKIRVMQNSLNAGVISDRLRGRTDIPRYHQGLNAATNMQALPAGGMIKRPGFVPASDLGDTMLTADRSRNNQLIPYRHHGYGNQYEPDYVLAFFNEECRVYSWDPSEQYPHGGNNLAATFVTPYLADQVADIQYRQHAEWLYLTHPYHPPYRIRCNTRTDWTCEPLPLSRVPLARPEGYDNVTLTPSAISGRTTVTANQDIVGIITAIGSIINVNGGLFLMDEFIDFRIMGGVFIAPIVVPDNTTNYTDTYTLTFTPADMTGNATVTCTSTGIRTVGTYAEIANVVTTSPATLPAGISIVTERNNSIMGGYEQQSTVVTVTAIKAQLTAPVTITVTVINKRKIATWDPGSSAAWGVITYHTLTPSSPPAGVTQSVSATTAAMNGLEPDSAWQLNAWSDLLGWPRSVAFMDQRLIFGGSYTYPTTVWGSRIADPQDFTAGATADAPFSIILSAATTGILSMSATDRLYIFTADKELTLELAGASALAPQIKIRTTYGSGALSPLVTSGVLLFASSTAQRIRALSYRFDIDGYQAPDITTLSDQLFRESGGIVSWTYAGEPYNAIIAVTGDGGLLCGVYDRDLDVMAWTPWHIGEYPNREGWALSVCTIRDTITGLDTVWLSSESYLRFNDQAPRIIQVGAFTPGVYLDGGGMIYDQAEVTFYPAELADTTTTMQAVIDGCPIAEQVVDSNGTLALLHLPRLATSGFFGYPYSVYLQDLPVDLTANGTTQIGANMALARIRVRVVASAGFTINGLPPREQNLGDTNTPPYLSTGDHLVQVIGRGTETLASTVTIEQILPLPLLLTSIIKELSVNDG